MFDHCLYFNTSALARQLDRLWAEAYRPFGLTAPQGFMLRTVLAHPGLLQNELAESLVISRPTATRALDGLADKGLITRRPSNQDGRQIEIHPTESAREISAALNAASAHVSASLKKSLGAEIFTNAVGNLKDIRTALE
jgi:DNA-binding MarR family transcriptional regulator